MPKINVPWNNIRSIPVVDNADSSIIDTIPEIDVPNVETFPDEEVVTGVVVFAGVAAALYIGVCVIGAFFTGGQSLWGLTIFA